MEYLDIYDENQNYLGKEDRNVVHRDALWHKTVHCWLYDNDGNVYFQIRKKEGKLYTTASGHILSGETVKQGFGREIEEEIGIKVNIDEAKLVDVVKFMMDKVKDDGSVFRDRVFANVYVCQYDGDEVGFNFDDSELAGLVRVNASETLDLLKKENGKIFGDVITKVDDINTVENKEIDFQDFLVNKGEVAIEKYGDILNKVIELTK